MEQLTLKMQQETKVHWRYKWPLNRKVKWHVQKLLARKQQQELRKWLRHVETLSDTEEELIHICEPETGRNLSDEEEKRSVEDLINCQGGRSELSSFQVGNERRSVDGLIDFQEGSDGSSSFQVGNGERSGDLIDCQVGREKIPSCQVGKGEEMNSVESSYQQGVLMEEDQRCVLIIGGIQIFLQNSPAEANTSVAHEEVVQQESKKEAMEPNSFKANYVCDAGVAEEIQPTNMSKRRRRRKH
jgi:hypothetical protein